MPTEEENVTYLYLVLTSGGANIDWDKVSEELDLKRTAALKRWSRLKNALAKGESGGPLAQSLLWLCMKHSTRDKAIDWADIAVKCHTTAGAASKRYSRMKVAFENGTAVPPATPSKATGRGSKAGTPTPTPKRKRAAPVKKVASVEDDGEDDDKVDEKPKPKRARVSKKKTAKEENEDDEDEQADEEEVEKPEPKAKAKRAAVSKKKAAKQESEDGEDEEADEEADEEEVEKTKPKAKRAATPTKTAATIKKEATQVTEDTEATTYVFPKGSLLSELEAAVQEARDKQGDEESRVDGWLNNLGQQ